MIDTPPKHPFLPTVKASTSLPFFHTLAGYIDEVVAFLCERIGSQPLVIRDVEATGAMQSVPLSPAFKRPPSYVLAVIREPPHQMAEGKFMVPYRIDYGTHTKDEVQVKVTFDDRPSK